MIYEFNHYGIVVQNLEKSLAFYQGLLGGRIVYQGLVPASQTDVIYLLIAGGLVELLHPRNASADETFGVTHLAFLSNDLDADHAALVAAGCKSLVAPKVAGTGVGRLAFVAGPNGERVEILQRDVKMRGYDYDHPIIRNFDHFSLIANDEAAALEFYQRILGMKTLKVMKIATSKLTMTYLHYDHDVLELLHQPVANTRDPIYAHMALRVDNVDEALSTFARLGIPAEPGTPRLAGTGIGRVGVIRDPDGVKIELVDRPDLRELA
jgi:catechol 2,3-dioxygenase-like lactoylglutathione lyase family enzyme